MQKRLESYRIYFRIFFSKITKKVNKAIEADFFNVSFILESGFQM